MARVWRGACTVQRLAVALDVSLVFAGEAVRVRIRMVDWDDWMHVDKGGSGCKRQDNSLGDTVQHATSGTQ
jgi:hypothetical protein